MVSDEDKKMLLSACYIAINPMLNGSGTNIKMFEYLAAGLPTISSSVGARGINNEDAFIETDLKNFCYQFRDYNAYYFYHLFNSIIYNWIHWASRKTNIR